MKKNQKDNRRQFLKNTSLSLLSVAVFPTILNSENTSFRLSKKDSFFTCYQSTEDANSAFNFLFLSFRYFFS